MERTETFSRKIRWLAIATGIASALALFPILALIYPALLIVGGIVQPRFPSAGRWLVWAGAAELWLILITYDVKFFHPRLQLSYMTLTFSVSTALLMWCSAELIADGLNLLRSRRSMPRAKPRPVGWGFWIAAAVLNFVVCWSVYGLVSWHRQAGGYRSADTGLYLFGMPLVTAMIVIAFDTSLARRVIEMKHTRERKATSNGH